MLFIDQMNHNVVLENTPKRIISLVPSQTELLYDLGLNDEVVGITRFCVHPNEWFKTKTKIGGTKNYDIEKIKGLNPDLIIGNKEENNQAQLEYLVKHYPVWMSDISTLKDAFDMITSVGTLVGKQQQSILLKLKIESEFQKIKGALLLSNTKRIAYFIWQKPYMIAAGNTFINEMLTICGFTNVFSTKSRYPEITENDLAAANPELIMLSSEPYPFKEKHIQEFKRICPDAEVIIVDGELFSWYGSRLLNSPSYFTKLIQQVL